MSKAKRDHQLVLETRDFLAAIKTIKPHRVNAAAKLSECQLGYVAGEAVFCVNGVQTRRPAAGNWPGFASFRLEYLLAFLKVPPAGDQVVIRYADGKAKIASIYVPATWAGTPDWIAEITLEGHLNGPHDDLAPANLFCPKCAKREGVLFRDLILRAGRYPVSGERIFTGDRILGASPTRECRACGHQWIELSD